MLRSLAVQVAARLQRPQTMQRASSIRLCASPAAVVVHNRTRAFHSQAKRLDVTHQPKPSSHASSSSATPVAAASSSSAAAPAAPAPFPPRSGLTPEAKAAAAAAWLSQRAAEAAAITPEELVERARQADREAAFRESDDYVEVQPPLRDGLGPADEGPMGRNPFAPKSYEALNALDGATCPSWAWNNAPVDSGHREAAKLLASLPYPRPLPPCYTHAQFRAPGDLADRWRRVFHVFSVLLCSAIAIVMILSEDSAEQQERERASGRPHIFAPIRQRWKAFLARLDPAMAQQIQRGVQSTGDLAREAKQSATDYAASPSRAHPRSANASQAN